MRILKKPFLFALSAIAAAVLLASCSQTERAPQQTAAPDFVLPSLAGGSVHLNAFMGKVVLLEFMSVTCGVCDSVNADISALYDEFSKDGFTPVMISLDPPGTNLAGYARYYKVAHPVAMDSDHQAAALYRVRGTPTLVLIDKKGIVRRLWQGYGSNLPQIMKNEIQTLLAENSK